jgi:hypothetical protein
MAARIVFASMARAFLAELPNCLPHCLPRRVFEAGKIAEMLGPQAFLQKASALPPKADMCGATRDVRFGPIADIVWLLFDHLVRD